MLCGSQSSYSTRNYSNTLCQLLVVTTLVMATTQKNSGTNLISMFNAAAFSGVSFCTVISSNHLFASGPEKSAH